jgi:hypothetical protein
MKNLLYGLLISLLGVAVFVLFHDTALLLYEKIFHRIRPNLNWGLSVNFALYLFILLSVTATLLSMNSVGQRRKCLFFLLALVVFSCFWIKDLSYTPLRTGLLILSAAVGFFSFFLIHRILRRWLV